MATNNNSSGCPNANGTNKANKTVEYKGVLVPRVDLVYHRGRWITRPVFQLLNPPTDAARQPMQLIGLPGSAPSRPLPLNPFVTAEFLTKNRGNVTLRLLQDYFDESDSDSSSDDDNIKNSKNSKSSSKPSPVDATSSSTSVHPTSDSTSTSKSKQQAAEVSVFQIPSLNPQSAVVSPTVERERPPIQVPPPLQPPPPPVSAIQFQQGPTAIDPEKLTSASTTVPNPKETSTVSDAGGPKMVHIRLAMEEGEPPGMTLDNDMQVTKVQPGSIVDGKFEVGDVVKTINGFRVNDLTDFWKRLNKAQPGALTDIQAERSADRRSKLMASRLPQQYEELIRRRPDCTYSIEQIDTAGKPPGIVLETLVNQVAIVKVKVDSPLAGMLKEFDVILAVDKIRVSEAVVARELIRERGGTFEALLERRDVNSVAYKDLKQALALKQTVRGAGVATTDEWGEFGGPPDIQQIVEEAKQRSSSRSNQSPKPIYHGGIRKKSDLKLGLNVNAVEVNIHSDIDPNKQLRHVPKSSP